MLDWIPDNNLEAGARCCVGDLLLHGSRGISFPDLLMYDTHTAAQVQAQQAPSTCMVWQDKQH